ncbi:MAG TPA: hypothetical protein VNL70_07075 [Tepidisphaeraceae bacterium]|nr:hypothetical protein [Tepidisphaeraceae bacterium]
MNDSIVPSVSARLIGAGSQAPSLRNAPVMRKGPGPVRIEGLAERMLAWTAV